MSDRRRKVRLSEPPPAVDQERVVLPSRPLRDGSAGTESEPVGFPNDERVEGVLSVEAVHSSEREALDARPGRVVHRCLQAKSPAITASSYRVTCSPSARMASRFLDPPQGR